MTDMDKVSNRNSVVYNNNLHSIDTVGLFFSSTKNHTIVVQAGDRYNKIGGVGRLIFDNTDWSLKGHLCARFISHTAYF